MKKVLTIAGSDSGGGAGIQADLKTMTVHQVYGASVITAVTAQNTLGVQGVKTLSVQAVISQLDSVLRDIEFSALKTGMLANSQIIEQIAAKIKEYSLPNLVVDPVMVATSGDLLLKEEAVETYKEKLFPLAEIITPNLYEAKVLAGVETEENNDPQVLAEKLITYGSSWVLIKGGHTTKKRSAKKAVDLLYDGSQFIEFEAEHIPTNNTHGTGCTLSAAVASNLARGMDMEKAVGQAKKFITGAIKNNFPVGQGNSPVNHLWRLQNLQHSSNQQFS
ncbi:hydroxymethylpyrimidine/phosphomethylpyrimidine kinase [Halanaerobium congolense]|uniref:Hydroxymethylpyrimidine/phosphomethylpyrimidine kinase n=1 Tax=Halanaerobium congolense TaxID=54121 RepID=A0A1G8I7W6_9FIRM|nr:bifunctional hydroxymethylpyrimidine kinase/phosphomethylpyrimidine kinase [Halanaerobium congolense]SDI14944.1 hydroxymethylpyrimidine/phosphomethylpyrimidine kinase [Halanaerobium congolense]SES75877.1 hydroxymethylpyrimidine/phosphomethylpyrimidine kinase [Halanaerobium congolense]